MRLEEAEKLARNLLDKHGLIHWYFTFDNAKTRFGSCRYRCRYITLSRHFVVLNDKYRVKNTILHEIAHALVGNGNGHNWVWQQKALEIGCDGRRCFSRDKVKMPKPNYTATCKSCGKLSHRYRKPRKQWSCGRCGGGRFDEKYLLEFKRLNPSKKLTNNSTKNIN